VETFKVVADWGIPTEDGQVPAVEVTHSQLHIRNPRRHSAGFKYGVLIGRFQIATLFHILI